MKKFEEKLAEALRKDREGRGLKNSEITLVRAFQAGKIDEEGSPPKRARQSEGDSRGNMSAGRDTLWQEEGEPGSTGSGYTEGAASDVVGSDGKLNKVVRHSTYAAPTAYPTILQTVNGTVTAKLDGDGIQVSTANYLIELNPAGAAVVFRKVSGTHDILFDLTLLARDMGIKTWDVCNSGSPAQAEFISSDPY